MFIFVGFETCFVDFSCFSGFGGYGGFCAKFIEIGGSGLIWNDFGSGLTILGGCGTELNPIKLWVGCYSSIF